ncbi:XylR family transcriptional regulator [Novipirellula artificiosorum]|uniref:Xylose operon regulatory protein n=1 Tax=Novipirellula artificiosorum TaxID=2528016 RepID=A0A5C6D5S7_9BACT|nr:DNA-binding transcriptional regulator [Novipirellula artificiosorum]TWU31395.1 Xylose operon regulatory protein [Novipirellula artificiosorum]
MKPKRDVAVLIETSREYGRGLLRGVARFNREATNWSIYFKQQDLGAPLPDWFKTWRGDGILARVTDRKMGRAILKTGIPLIDLRGAAGPLGVPSFGIENTSVARAALDHLVDCGLKQFAFVGEPTGRYLYDDLRRNAFVSLVQQHGSTCHVFKKTDAAKENDWKSQQQELANWLVDLPKPIGVMCCHDDRGRQVLDACQRANLLVPDQVAVIGVDNDEFLCQLSDPALTSVNIDAERIGFEAAVQLDRLMNDQTKLSQPVWFEATGVVARQSTDIIACDDPIIAKAIRLIRQQACNQLTVDDVEKHLPISRSLLNRRFKEIVGRTPKQEIVRLQMQRAIELLQQSSASIESISEQCGFNEAWYFISIFRKHFGITPAKYRGHRS